MWSLTRCGAFAPLLWEYAEGKLQDAKERARVEEHVAGCDRCRAELAAIQEVAGAWASFAGTPSPAAAPRWEAVRERIAAPAGTSAPLRRRPVIAATALAGAFFAGVLGVTALLLPLQTANERDTTTAAVTSGGFGLDVSPSDQTMNPPAPATSNRTIMLSVDPAFVGGAVGSAERGPIPLVVTIKNRGAAFSGSLVVEPPFASGAERRYVQRVDVPARATARFFAYPHCPGDYRQTANVTLTGSNLRLETLVPLYPNTTSSNVKQVGYIGDGIGVLMPFRSGARPDRPEMFHSVNVNPAYATPENAPDRVVGYDALDLLVLGRGAERLGAPQWSAIREWVLTGGSLILLGGPDAPILRTREGADLAPVAWVAGEAPLSNAPIKIYSMTTGAIGVAASDVTPGRLKPVAERLDDGIQPHSTGNRAVKARRPFGMGTVLYVGYDPTSPAARRWDGLPSHWEMLVFDAHPLMPVGQNLANAGELSLWDAGDTRASASDPFRIPLPSLQAVLYLFLTYFLLAIPVTFVVLKRFRCMNLAWATGPVLAVVFAGAFFLFTASLYTAKLSRRTSGVLIAAEGERECRFAGSTELFFPRAGAYDVTVPGAEQIEVSSLGGYDGSQAAAMRALETVDSGSGVAAPAFRVTNLAFRRVSHSQKVTWGGITADLRLDENGRLVGTITNRTGRILRSAAIVTPRRFHTNHSNGIGEGSYPVGDLPAGSKSINATLPVTVSFLSDPAPADRPFVVGTWFEDSADGGGFLGSAQPEELRHPVLEARVSGEDLGPALGQWVGGDRSVMVLVRLNDVVKGGLR